MKLDHNKETHICSYGCGNKAYFYFPSANKWCCSDNFRKCLGFRKQLSISSIERYKDTPTATLRRNVKEGKAICVYCGNIAKHISNGKPCCSQYSKQCPEHANWRSRILKEGYNNNPERAAKMIETLKESQNRKEVKLKKSIAMLKLHNSNCIPCVEFQENFKKGREFFRTKLENKIYNKLIKLGVPTKYIPSTYDKQLELLRVISYKLSLLRAISQTKNRLTPNVIKEGVTLSGGLSI